MDGQANLGLFAGTIALPSHNDSDPRSESFEWTKGRSGEVKKATPQGALYLPLDEFLQVEVLHRKGIRSGVTAFLEENCAARRTLGFYAGRGKLIAELAGVAGTRFTFGDLVKHANVACKKSESRLIRSLDARELARFLCLPAIDN